MIDEYNNEDCYFMGSSVKSNVHYLCVNDINLAGCYTHVYLNAYNELRRFGGPEEGGWWWSQFTPIASVPISVKSSCITKGDGTYPKEDEDRIPWLFDFGQENAIAFMFEIDEYDLSIRAMDRLVDHGGIEWYKLEPFFAHEKPLRTPHYE